MNSLEAKVEVIDAKEIGLDKWWTIREIARFAFRDAIDSSRRSDVEIDYSVGMDDKNYYAGMYDPNIKVGHRLNDNQQFWKTRLAVATVDGSVVAYSYSADNTSGSRKLERQLKHFDPRNSKNYFWLGSMAVMPELKDNKIGSDLIEASLQTAHPRQPVSAYLWPQELGQWQVEKLEQLGFVQTGETKVKPFGPDTEPTLQVRMQAPSARIVLENIQ